MMLIEQPHISRNGDIVYVIEFNGKRYTRYPKGKRPNYYFTTHGRNKPKTRLHRDIYEFYNGAIPEGYDIHHIDNNPLNNDISNLMLVSKSEHQKIHDKLGVWNKEHPELLRKNGYSKENWAERRATAMERLQSAPRKCELCGKEYIATNVHQRFCSRYCHHRWQYTAPEHDTELVCQNCGKTFMGNKYYIPKTCCQQCTTELVIKKRRAKR